MQHSFPWSMHRVLYWINTQLKGDLVWHSSAQGTLCFSPCLYLGVLLWKGRALLSSDVLSAWETLMEWPTKQTLSRLNNFWKSSALVLPAAGLCYGVQMQKLAWPGGLPGISFPSCSPPLPKVNKLDWSPFQPGQKEKVKLFLFLHWTQCLFPWEDLLVSFRRNMPQASCWMAMKPWRT